MTTPVDNSENSTNGQDPTEGDLRELKELLFRDELETLTELKQEVHNAKLTTEELATMLPKALHRSSRDGDRLGRALGPTIASAFEKSVKRNRQALADAISPIIGPAIRRAIAQTMRGMMQSLNKTLEYSLSAKGLKWRLEAMRTGKPFAEIVLLNVLKYRVERVFLIHREDGLLLAEHVSEEAPDADSDLVSGMLTALRELGRESLGASQHETLDSVDFGGRTIWLEPGQDATLAAVIMGHPPRALRQLMRESVDKIHLEFAEAFQQFDGDSAPLQGTEAHLAEWKSNFSAADVFLEECVISEFREGAKGDNRSSIWKWAWVVPVLLLLAGGTWLASAAVQARRTRQIDMTLKPPPAVDWEWEDGIVKLSGAAPHDWIVETERSMGRLSFVDGLDRSALRDQDAEWLAALDQLAETPGVLITRAAQTESGYELEGLCDPLATPPEQILAAAGVPPSKVNATWTRFHSLEPELVAARFRARLPECETVSWQWVDGVLTAEGIAPRDWLGLARAAAEPWGREIDLGAITVIDDPALRALQQKWRSVLDKLAETPGIVITRAEQKADGFLLVGLRDPLAADPDQIVRSLGISAEQVASTWTRFNSMEPELVAKRFQQRLSKAPQISWTWQDGTLVAHGSASYLWLREAKTYANLMRDDLRVDFSQVENADRAKRDELRRELEAILIDHPVGRTSLTPGQDPKLREVSRLIELLRSQSERMGTLPQVVIVSYADPQMSADVAMPLSVGRARRLWQELSQLGLSDDHVIVKGMGAPPQGDSGATRFEVNFLGFDLPS